MYKLSFSAGVLVFLSLTGCVNLHAVGEFAAGAQALSQASEKFYDMSLDSDRQLARMSVNLDASANSQECRKQDGSFQTPWDCASKGENLISETRRNRAAVDALATYAQSLNEIANFDDDDHVEESAQELSGNLGKLAKTLDAAADDKESALAVAITGLAQIFIDLKTREVVREKAKLAQGHVATIVNLLRDDIKRQQQRLAMGRQNAKATREEWFESFRQKSQSPATSSAEKSALTIAAGHLVEDELTEKLAEQPNKAFLAQLDQTADSCLKAHVAIQNPDIGDKTDAVRAFVKDARTLLKGVRRLTD